ncbi:MAG: ATP-binding cassette domain-containing protein, partial [Actinomycetota bacterium]
MAGVGKAHLRSENESLLRVDNLVVEYKSNAGGAVRAVSDVSFDIVAGETVAVVGESGCGKSTLAKGVMQLLPTVSGTVILNGADLTKLKGEELRRARPNIQMIFQDSISSLDPHLKVRALVEQPLKVWGRGTDDERRE